MSRKLKHKKPELPPDPDGQNDDRADWAEAAIDTFMAETRTDRCDALHDLLADLMHWADRNQDLGRTFDEALETARGNYEAETDPDNPDQ